MRSPLLTFRIVLCLIMVALLPMLTGCMKEENNLSSNDQGSSHLTQYLWSSGYSISSFPWDLFWHLYQMLMLREDTDCQSVSNLFQNVTLCSTHEEHAVPSVRQISWVKNIRYDDTITWPTNLVFAMVLVITEHQQVLEDVRIIHTNAQVFAHQRIILRAWIKKKTRAEHGSS